VWEESQLGKHPKWDTMTDDEKSVQRGIVATYWKNNSFTKLFSDNIGCEFKNFGLGGNSNTNIVQDIVKHSHFFNRGDVVIVGWTSPLRDKVTFWPDNPIKWISSSKKVRKYFEELGKSFQLDEGKFDYTEYENKVEIEKFWEVFGKQWLAYGYDEEYHHLQSKQILYFTQNFLEYLGVKYLFVNAFESVLIREESLINMSNYWKGGKESIWSYINHDEDLLEPLGYNLYDGIECRHPSRKGHKYFSKSLTDFYREVYDG
jgi:hypothetical protein